MKSLEQGEQSMWAPSSKKRTECVNFRHADGVGVEMRVRPGDMIVQSSRAICEELRKCARRAQSHPAKGRAGDSISQLIVLLAITSYLL